MRSFLVDSAAALVFFSCVAGFTEAFLAGLTWDQVLKARLAAVPAILLTGRLYGLWRDGLMWRFAATRRGRPGQTAIDILAFVSFQVPVYAAILVGVGARPAEIATAAGAALGLMVLLSRPYGLYLDLVRRLAARRPLPGRPL